MFAHSFSAAAAFMEVIFELKLSRRRRRRKTLNLSCQVISSVSFLLFLHFTAFFLSLRKIDVLPLFTVQGKLETRSIVDVNQIRKTLTHTHHITLAGSNQSR